MGKDITTMYPESGRIIKEDGGVINIGDILEAVYDSVNGLLKTSASLSYEGDISIGAVELKDASTGTRAVVDSDGLHTNSTNRTMDVNFHESAIIPANGTPFLVGAYKTLTIEIYGTSTTRNIKFYGKSKSGTFRPIQGIRLSDFTLAVTTTTTAEIWQFDITGLDSVTMDLTAVTGGNVSIKGRVVS